MNAVTSLNMMRHGKVRAAQLSHALLPLLPTSSTNAHILALGKLGGGRGRQCVWAVDCRHAAMERPGGGGGSLRRNAAGGVPGRTDMRGRAGGGTWRLAWGAATLPRRFGRQASFPLMLVGGVWEGLFVLRMRTQSAPGDNVRRWGN